MPIKALILAAGMGSRLGRPNPKPLTPLASGKTILQHQIDGLSRYINGDDIYVVVGYKNDLIMEAFPNLAFVYNAEYDVTNTSKSLLRGLRKLRDADVLWMNGDVVFDHRIVPLLLGSPHSCMAVNTAAVAEEEIKYRVSPEGWINEVSKQVKDAAGEAVGLNKIIQRDIPTLLTSLETCAETDYFERGIELALADSIRFYPLNVSAFVCTEIDFEADLRRANQQLSRLTD